MADIILPVSDGITNIHETEESQFELTDTKVSLDNVDYTLDKEGNARDAEGKVFKTKDELASLDDNKGDEPAAVDEIEIDSVVYKLDDKGNALDDKGAIFMTKEKIDELSNNSDTGNIEDIIKLTGVVPVDDKGAQITYDSTPEGISQYISDVVEIRMAEESEAIRTSIFNDYPILHEAYLHVLRNGDLESFSKPTDWSGIDIEKADEDVLMSVVIADLRSKNITEERARRMASLYKADGKLKEEAAIAKDSLIATKAQLDEQAVLLEQQRKEEEDVQARNYWDAFEKGIKDGKITIGEKQVILPKVFRIKAADGKQITATPTDFLEYVTKPKQYKLNDEIVTATAYEVDRYNENLNRTVDSDIYDALKLFVKYDISQLIEEQIKNQNVKRIITSTGKQGNRKQISTESSEKAIKLQVQ